MLYHSIPYIYIYIYYVQFPPTLFKVDSPGRQWFERQIPGPPGAAAPLETRSAHGSGGRGESPGESLRWWEN